MKTITFDDQESFNAGLVSLEMNTCPDYAVDAAGLTILTENVQEITELLLNDGIDGFVAQFSGDDEPFDGFRTDAEADADALASAGFGTDEDYGGSNDGGYDE